MNGEAIVGGTAKLNCALLSAARFRKSSKSWELEVFTRAVPPSCSWSAVPLPCVHLCICVYLVAWKCLWVCSCIGYFVSAAVCPCPVCCFSGGCKWLGCCGLYVRWQVVRAGKRCLGKAFCKLAERSPWDNTSCHCNSPSDQMS